MLKFVLARESRDAARAGRQRPKTPTRHTSVPTFLAANHHGEVGED